MTQRHPVRVEIINRPLNRPPLWKVILFLSWQNPLPLAGSAIVLFCLGVCAAKSTPHNIAVTPQVSPHLYEELKPDPKDMVFVERKTRGVTVNENAPKIPEKYDAQAYIRRFANTAVNEMRRTGIPASISLAQGLIESRAGTSKLAVNANNHFGMKCFSKHCRKGHCINMTDDTHKDFFKAFPTAHESWKAHSDLLTTGRYKKLHRYGRSYRKWAYGLKSTGYATDRTYAEKLIGIIERYNLHRYDH